MGQKTPVLQIVHGTDSPFLELAGHYAAAFERDVFSVTTVFLSGEDNARVRQLANSDEVFCLCLSSADLAGLKRTAVKAVRALCQQRAYQLIIAQRYKALYVAWQVARFLPAPRILGVAHAFGVMKPWGRRALFRRHRRYTWLAGVSRAVCDDLLAACPASLADHIVCLQNCVDSDRLVAGMLDRHAARRKLQLSQDSFVFANVGRLHPDKDQLSLLEAFGRVAQDMPNACLVLVGEGRLRVSLEARIRALALEKQVHLSGRIDDAWRLFRAFDVYVSSSDREPFGIVLNEAQAAAIPIIAADCGGAAEVLADTGCLYSRAGARQLDQALLRVYRMSEEERRVLGERGQARLLREYSRQAFAERLRQLAVVAPLFRHASRDPVSGTTD